MIHYILYTPTVCALCGGSSKNIGQARPTYLPIQGAVRADWEVFGLFKARPVALMDDPGLQRKVASRSIWWRLYNFGNYGSAEKVLQTSWLNGWTGSEPTALPQPEVEGVIDNAIQIHRVKTVSRFGIASETKHSSQLGASKSSNFNDSNVAESSGKQKRQPRPRLVRIPTKSTKQRITGRPSSLRSFLAQQSAWNGMVSGQKSSTLLNHRW